jgi:protein-disulfide isomerase
MTTMPISREAKQSAPIPPVSAPSESIVQRKPRGFFEAPPKFLFAFGLLVGVAVTAVTMYFVAPKSNSANPSVKGATAPTNTNTAVAQQPSEDPTKVATPTSKDHYRGVAPDKAKVVIVEYSDFQCPYCSRLQPTLQRVIDEYGDKVSWVFRQFPLPSPPQGAPSALASECAAEQGKFWEYADKLFANQASLAADYYPKLATELGLDATKFNSCISSNKYSDAVTAMATNGDAAGVSGTPSSFIYKGTDMKSGQAVSGALPYETFKAAIDSLLK